MTAATLLLRLELRGVVFSVLGDTLHWHAPVGVVTAEDADALRTCKAEVLAILRDDAAADISERAAIFEHDHGLTRLEAERFARSNMNRQEAMA